MFATFLGLLWDNEASVTPEQHEKSSVGLLLWKLNLFKVASSLQSKKSRSRKSLAKAESSEHNKET